MRKREGEARREGGIEVDFWGIGCKILYGKHVHQDHGNRIRIGAA